MMQSEEYLGIWQVTKDGRSVPLDYDALRREIERLNPEETGYKTVQRLEAEGLISTRTDGKRILTAMGLANRIPLPSRPAPVKPIGGVSDEKAWTRFRLLCAYYADCVTQSEKVQEYLFAQDIDNKYLLPVLPVGWMTDHTELPIKYNKRSLPAVNRIKTRRDDEEDVYIGYPLSAFHDVNGKMVYSPILLFPVDIAFDRDSLRVTIRHEEVDINRSWLEANVPRNDQKDVQTSICFSEGENTGLLNATVAVQYIANRFKAALAPDHLDYDVAHRAKGVVNSAALFVGNRLKYSKTLKKELRHIAKQPAAVLDRTALAYVFRDPIWANEYEREPALLPLDFLSFPANQEQRTALEEALNRPASKVTGPPGTGKSQVAANLIANLVFYGRSVLFTSKNHKAIHAIYERCDEPTRLDEESSVTSPALVQFCSTPAGDGGADWSSQTSIDQMAAKLETLRESRFPSRPPFADQFEDTLDNWRDYRTEMAEIDETRARFQEIQARYDTLLERLSIPENELTIDYHTRLQNLLKQMDCGDGNRRTFFQKIFDFILRRKYRALNAETELRALLASISAESKSAATFKKRAERLCGDIADWLSVQEEELSLSGKMLDLPEESKKLLARDMDFRQKHLKLAFLYRRVTAPEQVSDEMRQSLKDDLQQLAARGALPFLSSIVDGDDRTRQAGDLFGVFSRFFPAWAATLLSLAKTSPCLAGIFDRVIIDEASQCELPPIIPALFRARGVTVIGDPQQFPPVITLRDSRHAYIRHIKHKLNELADNAFDFTKHNAFDVVPARPLMLREHFRSHADIVGYCNEEYYGNKLRVRTPEGGLKFPANMGFTATLVWKEIQDSLDDEINAVKKLFQDLAANGYEGSVGVISPFRKVVERIKQALYGAKLKEFNIDQDVNTANGFQGGERDLIVFVLGYTSQLKRGEDWYAVADENRYIYNVAVSRARACLIVVGDRERARQAPSSALRNLAKDACHRPHKNQSQSPGEETLYRALLQAGFAPKQQYPLAGRYLDMALVDEKIDIEVDGAGFHLNRYGERKADDIFRDLQVESCGWRVCRFWYREVRDDLGGCVAKVKDMATMSQVA